MFFLILATFVIWLQPLQTVYTHIRTERRSCLDPSSVIVKVFLKESFVNLNLEKSANDYKNNKISSMQRVENRYWYVNLRTVTNFGLTNYAPLIF